MSEIEAFLSGLGLDTYCEVFAENDIDLTVAPDLTETDLERLGLSLGHRRKFIAAAARLRSSPRSSELKAAPKAAREVERRQVTVLFADLVGSTALANELDPEDLNRVMADYRDACTAIVTKFDGHIAQFLGDGVLAYFGYPRAQEQAAERAIRAALALLIELARPTPAHAVVLQTRIGIATGLVVGETGTNGGERDQTVIGTTPNLAARLQGLAQPGSVLVAQSTRQLTGDFFKYASAGEHAIKGFERAVAVWRVLGERNVESRFAAARSGSATAPIVARERELAFLRDSWERATAGHGHVVLVVGEAGMGKSRLVEALVERVREEPHRLLRAQCSPYHANSVLYPIAQLIRYEASLQQDRPVDDNLQSIAALLTRIGRTSRRDVLLIAELLDVPSPDRLSDMELTRQQRNTETVAILEDFLLWAPANRPVLLLIEDVHWSDPTTQGLVERLLLRVEKRSALILITSRPEFRKPWGESPQATILTCKQLGFESCRTLVRRATVNSIDDALVEEIVKRSDGVPLYVEELTKAVLEMQGVHAVKVPETLQDSLMARLDRLGPSKEIALVASIIGRSFSYQLLAATAGAKEDALRRALGSLLEAGLLFNTQGADEESYVFNHSLVQEAAYESVSRSRRQAVHLRIARILESQEGQSGNAPEVIAFHFSRAAEPAESCKFWMLAADKAGARSSFAEAIANLNGALREAERIPDHVVRATHVLDVQLRLGANFLIQAGPLSPDAQLALNQAYALAKEISAERQLFQAAWGLYISTANSRRFEEAKAFGDELLDISGRLADDDLQVEGLHHRWGYWYFTGRNERMLHYAREGTTRYDPSRHHRLAQVYAGHDLGVCAHCVGGIALGLAGLRQEATASIDSAVALAESLRHPTSLAFALGAGSVALHLAGDIEACRTTAQRAVRVAERYDLALPRAFGHFMVGLGRTEQDDMPAGLALMEANHAATVRHSFLGLYPDVVMADALVRGGRPHDALALVTRTLDTVVSPEVGLHVSELWRMRGELMLASSGEDHAKAERFLRLADRISNEQGATIYQARARSALERLL